MNDWVTVLTTDLPQEAHLAKAKLESEGINVFMKDEMTAQVHNFYSNAIGGVKLQIEDKDYQKAMDILKASGYIRETEQSENKTLKKFDRITAKIPYIRKMMLELRLVGAIALIILAIIGLILIVSKSGFY
ncbi:MAG: DUF2007 domain-containing protein [Bacteroidales bacterium]|nr:DUF2007 domain-containing protein [Bacteroidales bacterium]MCF8327816.1 DUF2007 domain-containing protein [Bacteroidales bacterium]